MTLLRFRKSLLIETVKHKRLSWKSFKSRDVKYRPQKSRVSLIVLDVFHLIVVIIPIHFTVLTMFRLKYSILLFLVVVEVRSTPTDDGFCSNVYQMHRHCVNQGTSVPDIRQGKAGPIGPKGEEGAPGVVDYAVIDRKIAQDHAEFEARYSNKFTQCELAIQHNEEEIEQLKQKLLLVTVTDCRKVSPEDAKSTSTGGGIFDIYPESIKTEVYCDQTTDGGGWMVFQRRMNGSVDFYQGWTEYVNGFGNKDGEFWLGLETLHRITTSRKYELRVDLEDWSRNKRFAKYSTFRIGDASTNYQLTIGGYSGTATDSVSGANGRAFSTKDSDHDTGSGNCAVSHKGAWWYGYCHSSNLNGLYHRGGTHSSYADGINWRHWKGYHYSMKFAEMKIRPLY